MNKPEMSTAKRWLRLLRCEGDFASKARYLRERGYTAEEIEVLIEEEIEEARLERGD
jgi:hypothetical protein